MQVVDGIQSKKNHREILYRINIHYLLVLFTFAEPQMISFSANKDDGDNMQIGGKEGKKNKVPLIGQLPLCIVFLPPLLEVAPLPTLHTHTTTYLSQKCQQ